MKQKDELRKIGIQNRNRLTPEENIQHSARIVQQILELPEFQKARKVLIYRATAGEVNLEDLTVSIVASGIQIAYPYCVNKSEMIALQPYEEDAWKAGRYGIMEPIPERSGEILPQDIDLVICPCTVFDQACNRIGMGAGYYDRYLEFCENASVIAVAFESQKVEEVPVEPWDKPMEMVITEQNIYIPIK